VTSPHETDAVLVPALRPPARAQGLLAALEALPRPAQVVLRGSYLEGRTAEDLAAELSVTPAELEVLRTAALRALARVAPPTPPRRSADARGVHFSA